MNDIELWHGDCMTELFRVADQSIDAIICDLPFGVTSCKWDQVIPMNDYIQVGKKRLERDGFLFKCYLGGVKLSEAKAQWEAEKQIGLWTHYKRVLKPRGAVVLNAVQPFTTVLVESNKEWFKHEIIWSKGYKTGFQHCKKKPLKEHENVLVFSSGQTTYNPQMQQRSKPLDKTNWVHNANGKVLHKIPNPDVRKRVLTHHYPSSIWHFNAVAAEANIPKRLHPSQKTIFLIEQIIRTYTNPGDLVLDNCAGSGTTLVAALNTGRRAIGIEKEREYYDIAVERIAKARTAAHQLELI